MVDEPVEVSPRDVIIARGIEAQVLLDSPALASVIREIRSDFLQGIVDSASHDTKKREDAYYAIRTLDTIVNLLRTRVQQMDTELQLLEAEQNEESDNDE